MQNLQWAGLSDVGRVRAANQDRWFVDPQGHLFIVSDGVGGHLGGEIAAQAVVDVLPRRLRRAIDESTTLENPGLAEQIADQVARLSRTIRSETQGEPGLSGMGATVVLALVRHMQALVLHLGDSRAYLLRDGRLSQLTRDHSLVQLLVAAGKISEREARTHPASNQLTRCVGMDGAALADTQIVDLRPADRLLLCTDGLSNMLKDEVLEDILTSQQDPDNACRMLIDRANVAGGRDNITAVVIAV